ncbi:MAG: hypothetical protein KDA22_14030, partial [Phycisphaerales bacterium]|nr:hypothetical protein [Phycisphaerales bacterium]
MAATVSALVAEVGEIVEAGAPLVVLEVMKMEHPVHAPERCRVVSWAVDVDEQVEAGDHLAAVEVVFDDIGPAIEPDAGDEVSDGRDGEGRSDLAELARRRSLLADEARPEAVSKRHGRGGRTARENVTDLLDEGSFQEYGGFAFAAQESRRGRADLEANTPADGMVTGIGAVNGAQCGEERARTVVMAYDATVLAGTQGARNHAKTDRMLGIALDQQLPVVLFAEGGGGRPGDTDIPVVAGLHVHTFASHAALSGQVPVVGIAAGRCFAGNAALLGCCDAIIATRASNIGMGGPAMIEGGGLGVFKPEQIGPSAVQHANGVIDVLVEDEREAVAAAR